MANLVGAKTLQKMWEGPHWEGVWPFLDPWDVVGLHRTASVWKVPGKYGPHGELFLLLIKEELYVLTKVVEFRPCVTAKTLEACALIGLHMITEEATSSSSSGLSPELGGMWSFGGPRNSFWKGDEGGWTESDCTSSCEAHEHNVESVALEVIGQDLSSEGVSFCTEDGELAREALSCHMALDCAKKRGMRATTALSVFTFFRRLSHLGMAVTVKRGAW